LAAALEVAALVADAFADPVVVVAWTELEVDAICVGTAVAAAPML